MVALLGQAGRLAADILDALVPHVVPGVTTQELDDIVRKLPDGAQVELESASDGASLVIRAGLLAGGVVNSALAFFALGLLISGIKSSSNSAGQTKDWLAHLLSWEYSNVLVYLIALVPLGVGIAHLIKGWKASFEKYFEADEDVMRYVRPVSRFGLIARGVVFIEIALLLALSGSAYQAMDPPGMKEALDALQNLPAGWLILMVMALGLIAFSVYSFSEAFWRKINMDVPGVSRA